MQDDEQRLYRRARERAKELRAFYTTLILYVVVNAFLFVVDMLTGGRTWFYWSLLGWGIGMVVWAIYLFIVETRFGDDWEERKAQELVERARRRAREER